MLLIMQDGFTTLHLASSCGNRAVVKQLLKHCRTDSYVNCQNKKVFCPVVNFHPNFSFYISTYTNTYHMVLYSGRHLHVLGHE